MRRSPGKKGSHFNPYSDLFQENERKFIVTSTLCWTLMFALLFYLSTVVGFLQLLKLYGIPYMVSRTKLFSFFNSSKLKCGSLYITNNYRNLNYFFCFDRFL